MATLSISLRALLAPAISVAAVTAQGGVYSQYEANFTKYAAQHWAQEGSAWEEANYYDRAEIFYNWYNRTGDSTYLNKANALAVNYRDNYLKPNDYAPSAHWSQMAGVALHYVATGDEASRKAVGRVADTFATPYYAQGIGNVHQADMDNRIQARTLEAFLLAKKIDAPSAAGHNWDSLLHSSLNKILSSQDADGAYRFDSFGGNVKPFMVGMLNDTLIDYYTMYEADSRILTAVKKSLDWLWANCWDEKSQSFEYLENSYGGETNEPAPDVNNMITSGFGWLYKMTGDATYKERGDAVFAGGVNGAWLDGSKQFNEQYTSSLKYLAYTLNDDDQAKAAIPPASLDKILEGTAAADNLRGGSGNDTLYGRGGNDVLIGGNGDDYLNGGGENEVLRGGGGADIFDFDLVTHSRPGDRDTIRDFVSGVDQIDLRDIDADTTLRGDQAFTFIGLSAFTGEAGELRFAGRVLSGDVNGDKVADFQVNVSGLSALAKGDFYL